MLEAMSSAMSDVSLKDVETLSNSAFSLMLERDVNMIQRQETPVRVPMILFFHKLLATMPVEMVREKHLSAYLKALSCIEEVDSGTQQTVSYSLHQLVDRLRNVHFLKEASDDLQDNLSNLRNWLIKC